MIAGGNKDGDKTDEVLEYDIDSNSYKSIQSLDGTNLATMVRKDNYMYYFGGIGSKEVFRIHLDLTSDWEKLDDMEDKGKSLIVIPYN